jgi:hypothetical protein
MKHLTSYIGLLIVGMTATAALLLENSLNLPQDVHFLLELLWVGVAIGGVFIAMIHPYFRLPEEFRIKEIPEWDDPDRLWMQRHPADDIDREEV